MDTKKLVKYLNTTFVVLQSSCFKKKRYKKVLNNLFFVVKMILKWAVFFKFPKVFLCEILQAKKCLNLCLAPVLNLQHFKQNIFEAGKHLTIETYFSIGHIEKIWQIYKYLDGSWSVPVIF